MYQHESKLVPQHVRPDETPAAHEVRLKRADLAASIGAGILGAGLGVLVAQYLAIGPFVAPLIVLGGIMHGWGMFERHRSRASAPRLWWAETLYWICWALLAILGVLILVRVI